MLKEVVASKQMPCCGSGWKPLLTIAFFLMGLCVRSDAFCAETAQPMARPDDPQIQAQLARAVALLDGWSGDGDDLVQAKQALDDVLRKDPHSAAAYREYARYYMDEGGLSGDDFKPGSLEAAKKALDKSIELSPGFAEAYVLQGYLYHQMKRPEEAKAALRKADELGTADPWLQLNWGELLMQDKKYEEAAARYKRVLDNRNANQSMKISAYAGLVPYYILTKRLDDADATYRAMIAYAPDKAWSRGNYAGFLLCWRDDYEHSIVEAQKARSLMDYGIARLTLVSALYRKWAAQVLEGHAQEARQTLQSALAIMPADPAQSVNEICGGGKPLKAVLQAMQTTGEGQRISPMEAVLLAAKSAPDAVPGIFAMQVQATGRSGGDLFLNSEPDYRDQLNLSIRMLPAAIDDFKRKYGSQPDVLLKGKAVSVLGSASRVKIDFQANGLPTGKYYYQTHVVVTDIAQITFVQ